MQNSMFPSHKMSTSFFYDYTLFGPEIERSICESIFVTGNYHIIMPKIGVIGRWLFYNRRDGTISFDLVNNVAWCLPLVEAMDL